MKRIFCFVLVSLFTSAVFGQAPTTPAPAAPAPVVTVVTPKPKKKPPEPKMHLNMHGWSVSGNGVSITSHGLEARGPVSAVHKIASEHGSPIKAAEVLQMERPASRTIVQRETVYYNVYTVSPPPPPVRVVYYPYCVTPPYYRWP